MRAINRDKWRTINFMKIRSSPPLPGTRSTSGTSKMPASVSKQRGAARSIPWSRRNRANSRKRCDQRYAFCYSCHIIRDFRTTLGRWSICIICMLTLFVVLPSHVIAGVPTIPNGVFALIKSGAPTGSSARSNPDVDGISLREGWDAVNLRRTCMIGAILMPKSQKPKTQAKRY
jgi:hypothetical protein